MILQLVSFSRRAMIPAGLMLLVISAGSCESKYIIPDPANVIHVIERNGDTYRPELDTHTRILVWNIKKGQEVGFANAFQQLSHGRDLILLQEFHLTDSVTGPILRDRTHNYVMATSFVYKADQTATGVATGSIASPIEVSAQVSSDREPFVKTPKVALFTEYRVRGHAQTLLMCNVHGLNRTQFLTFKNQLDRIGDVIRDHGGPVVFAGDFNTNSQEKLTYVEDLAAELGLEAVVFPDDTRTRTTLRRLPLDHIFVGRLSVQNAKVWNDIAGSDHKALSVDVTIEE